MRGSAAFRAAVAPGGVLAGPWVRNELWRRARAVPSLDLRFAENKSLGDAVTGQNLITFTRASSGTYVGSDGLIKTATTNLLLRSEEFDDASWTKTRCSVTANAIAAPDGSVTADRINEDTTPTSTHLAAQGGALISVIGARYTYSVYAKADGRDWLVLSPGSVWGYAWFNVSSGTLGTVVDGGGATTASITEAGNGWYRCIVSATAVDARGLQLLLASSSNSVTYTGDGTSGIYLWGAQLEQSSTVGEYIPTGATINSAPRFDHNPTTGESLGLLVEEQRQNLLLNSGTLSTQNVTVTAVAHTLSFTGTGTITLSGTSTAGPLVGTGTGEASRVSLTFTPTAGTLTLTVSGTVTNAQLEIGAFRTSYIPTTTAAVTRTADSAVLDGTGVITGTYTMVEKPEGCAVINGTDIELQNGYTIERVMVFPATLTAGQITAIRAAM